MTNKLITREKLQIFNEMTFVKLADRMQKSREWRYKESILTLICIIKAKFKICSTVGTRPLNC